MTPRQAQERAGVLVSHLTVRRKEMGLNKAEAARSADLGYYTIVENESGRLLPRLTTFITWADAMGYEICLVKKAP